MKDNFIACRIRDCYLEFEIVVSNYISWASQVALVLGKEPACQCRRLKRPGFDPWVRKIPLEEGMATHSSILAWEIPRTEEPGGLQSLVSQRVGHD